MSQLKRNLNKVGNLPGSVIYTGENNFETTKIELITYNQEEAQKRIISSSNDINPESNNIKWVNIIGLNDTELIKDIGKRFNISSLILEDIVHTGQRPKIDFYDGYIFAVLKMLSFDNKEMKIKQEQVSFILLPNMVITFQEVEGDVFDPIRKRISHNKGLIRKKGVDYLLYCLMDCIVDEQFVLLSKLEERMESIEEEMLSNSKNEQLQDIYKLKKELFILKTYVWPVKDIISAMLKEDSVITSNTKEYLKDVNDHVVQIMDFTMIYMEMISGMFDTYLSNASNKMNKIMTTLTIFSVIFIPLTFLAGVYGMNFKYIPELSFKWGYPVFWGICIVTAIGMYRFFKKKTWI